MNKEMGVVNMINTQFIRGTDIRVACTSPKAKLEIPILFIDHFFPIAEYMWIELGSHGLSNLQRHRKYCRDSINYHTYLEVTTPLFVGRGRPPTAVFPHLVSPPSLPSSCSRAVITSYHNDTCR